MIDHDRLFKELISTFFREFVELFLPEVSAYLEPEGLVFLDKEVFTDVTFGERYEADLVVKGRFKGEEAFFLIHVEHQARTEGEFGRRMFRYFARLCERHGLPVYPVVIFSYDAPHRAEPDSYRVEFPNKVVLEFNYDVIQLNRLKWRDYVTQENPVASALMAKMAMKPEERPRVKLECLRLLATLKLDPARMHLISGFVDTYLRLSREEDERFRAELKTIREEQQEGVMEIVTSWLEEGRQQGLEQGKKEGELRLALRQLNRRIGAIDEATERRIRSLSPPQLEELGEALLDFGEAGDLLRWLDENEAK